MNINGSDDVTALVGLDGMEVTDLELDDGRWDVWVCSTVDKIGCAGCGTRARVHDRRRHVVRDLPVAGVAVRLIWVKRLFRCPDAACAVRGFAESCVEIAERAVLTERARTHIARRVGPGGASVAALAAEFGVSWHTAMAAVRDHGRARSNHLVALGAPRAIGLDETSLLTSTASSHTTFVTHVVNLDTGDTIDVLYGRSQPAVSAWLASNRRSGGTGSHTS